MRHASVKITNAINPPTYQSKLAAVAAAQCRPMVEAAVEQRQHLVLELELEPHNIGYIVVAE